MREAWALALAIISVLAAVSGVAGIGFVLAQTSSIGGQAAGQAGQPQPSSGDPAVDAHRAQLQSELDALEKEINSQQDLLTSQQRQSVSLERDIAILDTKIKSAQLAIRATTIQIEQLGTQITTKTETIGALTNKLGREKQSLGQIVRATNELDSRSLPEVALADKNISDFFLDLDSFAAVEQSLKNSYDIVVGTRQQTEVEKSNLEDRQQQAIDLKHLEMVQKASIAADQAQKNKILTESRGQEKVYQQIIASKKQSAAEIRAELFELRGSAPIPFGKAYQYALAVKQKTGIRPAFLLGIIAEESNLGQNVGTGNWNDDMHPTRDRPIFAQLTAALGLDPNKMLVSKKAWYGWGGAMGPAQFIPSTWVLYTDRVASLTSHHPPNPWDPQDAFMASGLLLADSGGVGNERVAALCYLAGCKNARKPAYAFYANDVLGLAAKYQDLIDVLQQN